MSFVIGNSNTNNVGSSNTLKFNNAVIYDMGNWSESGTLSWDATTGNFVVIPSVELHEYFLEKNKKKVEELKMPTVAIKIPKKTFPKNK
jgi:hypothetical protein